MTTCAARTVRRSRSPGEASRTRGCDRAPEKRKAEDSEPGPRPRRRSSSGGGSTGRSCFGIWSAVRISAGGGPLRLLAIFDARPAPRQPGRSLGGPIQATLKTTRGGSQAPEPCPKGEGICPSGATGASGSRSGYLRDPARARSAVPRGGGRSAPEEGDLARAELPGVRVDVRYLKDQGHGSGRATRGREDRNPDGFRHLT